ncbi:MAG: hypothetical protein WBM78_16185, partial [Desulfobacterales bacterium]
RLIQPTQKAVRLISGVILQFIEFFLRDFMDYIPDYSKYNLDTLYEILFNIDKKEHPERVKEIVNRISSLEEASLRNQKGKKNKNRLKYALLSSEERLKVSQDPFACVES